MAAITTSAPAGSAPGEKDLKSNAIGFVSNVVIAMARRRVIPDTFGRVSPRRRTPTVATVVMGAVSLAGFNYSNPVLGIQVPIVIGIGGLLLGAVLMLAAVDSHRGFFRRRPEVLPESGPIADHGPLGPPQLAP
jgi:amino acid transporter